MIRDLSHAMTIIFDCDGVVLDSNRVKTEAFRSAARPWGVAAAEALVAHHVAYGGVSRYAKFAYFFDHILPQQAPSAVPGRDGPDMDALLAAYAQTVQHGLMTCPVADALRNLRVATPQARWLIVSGGDQAELREVFSARNIAGYFDGGIFGSPDTKEAILTREINAGNIHGPAVFLGDSRLDYEAAVRAGLEFIYVAEWSEWADGARLAAEGTFPMVRSLGDLLVA
jgi:phosphoglycolate phosphatase-like HAD superfamily hydrolase